MVYRILMLKTCKKEMKAKSTVKSFLLVLLQNSVYK